MPVLTICKRCGSTLFVSIKNGGYYCVKCGPSYQEYGRRGGTQTVDNHEQGYMAELGRIGGIKSGISRRKVYRTDFRTVPAAEFKEKELPNRIGELRELWNKNNGGSQLMALPARRGK